MPLNERNDRAMSYRRGYQDGASDMLHAVEQFLDPATRDVVRAWVDQDINGMAAKGYARSPADVASGSVTHSIVNVANNSC
jgi:hypothetical protein